MHHLVKGCILLVMTLLFAPIAISQDFQLSVPIEDVLDVRVSDQDQPVYTYKQTKTGLISQITEYYLNINNNVTGPFEEEPFLIFSNTGKAIGALVKLNGNYYIKTTLGNWGPFQDVSHISIGYSMDDKAFCFAAEEGGLWYIISDNIKIGPYNDIGYYFYTPDGKTFFFTTIKNGKWYVESGKDENGPYDNFGDMYYSEKTGLVYAAKSGDSYYVFSSRGKEGPYEDFLGFNKNDNFNLTYSAKIKGSYYVISGDEKYGPYDLAFPPVYFPDGKTIAYCAVIGDSRYVIVGKEKAGPYEDIKLLTISKKGDAIAYAFKEGWQPFWYIWWKHDIPGEYGDIGHITISPDSDSVAYAATAYGYAGEWNLYINGRKINSSSYEGLFGLWYSSDSQVLSFYAYVDGLYKSFIYYNGNVFLGSLNNDKIIYIENDTIRIVDK